MQSSKRKLSLKHSLSFSLFHNCQRRDMLSCWNIPLLHSPSRSWAFKLVIFFVLVIVVEVHGEAITKEGRYFISWEDLRLDHPKVGLNWTTNRVIVVDKDGNGNSVSVHLVPLNNTKRVKIFILPGIYREKVHVPKSKPYISFIGNKSRTSETVITWNDKASTRDNTGRELGTYRSASVTVESNYFCSTGITFQNTVVAVPGAQGVQAMALRISGDRAMLYRIRVIGSQDTLLDDRGTHYFYKCHVQGSIDFICGQSRSLYDRCVLQSTATGAGAVAAHRRSSPDENTGFSFVRCTVTGTGSIFLGRAWGNYSLTVYSYCYFHNIITPAGWRDWNLPYRQKTAVFEEYHCQGGGADTKGRVLQL
ncbi:hypothetical protein SAY87_018085 [Trapa incisa]|uniref:pectinesterase n=1 Tax=Trapa incisa TaxID=236973 RepID=A0AAN7KWX9_9MYRT|nr:hypothetical protein SAY87_018085 [Trapa incisa]